MTDGFLLYTTGPVPDTSPYDFVIQDILKMSSVQLEAFLEPSESNPWLSSTAPIPTFENDKLPSILRSLLDMGPDQIQPQTTTTAPKQQLFSPGPLATSTPTGITDSPLVEPLVSPIYRNPLIHTSDITEAISNPCITSDLARSMRSDIADVTRFNLARATTANIAGEAEPNMTRETPKPTPKKTKTKGIKETPPLTRLLPINMPPVTPPVGSNHALKGNTLITHMTQSTLKKLQVDLDDTITWYKIPTPIAPTAYYKGKDDKPLSSLAAKVKIVSHNKDNIDPKITQRTTLQSLIHKP